MKSKNVFLLFIFSLIVALVACEDEVDEQRSYEDQLEYEIEKILEYCADSNIAVVEAETKSGLHYYMEVEGTGNHPTIDSTIKVNYRGRFLNGTSFDGDTIEGLVSAYILGWQEGLPLFKEGGKGMLFVPSALGYGIYDYFGIPGNSTLVFDIELLEIIDD